MKAKLKRLVLMGSLLLIGMIPMRSAYSQLMGPYYYDYWNGQSIGYYCFQGTNYCNWYLIPSAQPRQRQGTSQFYWQQVDPCSLYNGSSMSAYMAYAQGCQLPEVANLGRQTQEGMNDTLRRSIDLMSK